MSIICQPEETTNFAIFDVNKHESTVLKSLLVNCFLVDMVHEKRIFPNFVHSKNVSTNGVSVDICYYYQEIDHFQERHTMKKYPNNWNSLSF